jgi:hypothetical protein
LFVFPDDERPPLPPLAALEEKVIFSMVTVAPLLTKTAPPAPKPPPPPPAPLLVAPPTPPMAFPLDKVIFLMRTPGLAPLALMKKIAEALNPLIERLVAVLPSMVIFVLMGGSSPFVGDRVMVVLGGKLNVMVSPEGGFSKPKRNEPEVRTSAELLTTYTAERGGIRKRKKTEINTARCFIDFEWRWRGRFTKPRFQE